jgi:hypothetical protein
MMDWDEDDGWTRVSSRSSFLDGGSRWQQRTMELLAGAALAIVLFAMWVSW